MRKRSSKPGSDRVSGYGRWRKGCYERVGDYWRNNVLPAKTQASDGQLCFDL